MSATRTVRSAASHTDRATEQDAPALSSKAAPSSSARAPELDYSKPLLGQVGRLGDAYPKWVYSPTTRACRLFASDRLEALSKCPWYAVPLVWLPVVLALSYYSLVCSTDSGVTAIPVTAVASAFNGTALRSEVHTPSMCEGSSDLRGLGRHEFAWHFAAGIALWSFLEYVLHRFVFHLVVDTTPAWITVHFLMHGLHHKFPLDRTRLVFPPLPAAILASIIYGVILLVVPFRSAPAIIAGGTLGYVCYDLMHFYLHHGATTSRLPYVRALQRAHTSHHYVNPTSDFGISSKVWDTAFGTLHGPKPSAAS